MLAQEASFSRPAPTFTLGLTTFMHCLAHPMAPFSMSTEKLSISKS